MAFTSRSRAFPARPQAIWEVLADFGAISFWVDGVDHSCLLNTEADAVGTCRRLQVGRNTLVECITEFDPPAALTYGIEGLPRRLGALANRWALRPTGGGTQVTVTSTVEIGPGPLAAIAERIIGRVMARQSDAMLAGLARRLEHQRD